MPEGLLFARNTGTSSRTRPTMCYKWKYAFPSVKSLILFGFHVQCRSGMNWSTLIPPRFWDSSLSKEWLSLPSPEQWTRNPEYIHLYVVMVVPAWFWIWEFVSRERPLLRGRHFLVFLVFFLLPCDEQNTGKWLVAWLWIVAIPMSPSTKVTCYVWWRL